ncbi:hypothetical protein BIY31_10180 [Gibbsiella quercinecans]|nr:hypothetical protein BIY30_20380 [Gibbsiella quercinecans]RLM09326.1 hypothetical protein BIY31_10180 [Gibbsiella quercinecans]
MVKCLRKWLKEQLSFFVWTYIPIILTVIFGVFMAHYFPDIAMQTIAIFFILMLIAVFCFYR